MLLWGLASARLLASGGFPGWLRYQWGCVWSHAASDLIQHLRQRPIPRPLPRRPTRHPNPPQIRQVILNDPRKPPHPTPSTAPPIPRHLRNRERSAESSPHTPHRSRRSVPVRCLFHSTSKLTPTVDSLGVECFLNVAPAAAFEASRDPRLRCASEATSARALQLAAFRNYGHRSEDKLKALALVDPRHHRRIGFEQAGNLGVASMALRRVFWRQRYRRGSCCAAGRGFTRAPAACRVVGIGNECCRRVGCHCEHPGQCSRVRGHARSRSGLLPNARFGEPPVDRAAPAGRRFFARRLPMAGLAAELPPGGLVDSRHRPEPGSRQVHGLRRLQPRVRSPGFRAERGPSLRVDRDRDHLRRCHGLRPEAPRSLSHALTASNTTTIQPRSVATPANASQPTNPSSSTSRPPRSARAITLRVREIGPPPTPSPDFPHFSLLLRSLLAFE